MSKQKGVKASSRGKGRNFFGRLANENDKRTSTKLIRSGVDVGGALLGGLLGSAIGKNAALFGLGVIVTGDFVGDRTGLYKTLGSGMLAYGVAKFMESSGSGSTTVQGLSGTDGMKERIGQYKNELLAAFYLDKVFKKSDTTTAATVPASTDESVGALDLSALDFFDDYNHQQANEYDYRRQLSDGSVSGTDDDDDEDTDFDYSIIDMPDMTRM